MDLYIGGSKGTSGKIYLNTGKKFVYKPSKVFINDSNYEDMESLFIDFDDDGDEDLFVVSGGSEFNERSTDLIDRLYINDENGNFKKSKQDDLNNYTISGKSISKIDFDKGRGSNERMNFFPASFRDWRSLSHLSTFLLLEITYLRTYVHAYVRT